MPFVITEPCTGVKDASCVDVCPADPVVMEFKNVKTGETTDIPASGYFSAIGHKPNTDAFVGQLEMADTGYLIVDGVKTKHEGVYAAGDVTADRTLFSACQIFCSPRRYLTFVIDDDH